jgi:hypothetical protein
MADVLPAARAAGWSAAMASNAIQIVPDPAAWTAATFKSPADYTVTLTDADRQQLRVTMRQIERQGRLTPPTKLTNSDFPLGVVGQRLKRAFEQVRSGYGFVVISGLPREGLTFDQFAAIVWGVNTFFGFHLSQNAKGDVLSYLVDATAV